MTRAHALNGTLAAPVPQSPTGPATSSAHSYSDGADVGEGCG